MLRLQLLGPTRLHDAAGRPVRPPTGRALKLLALLAVDRRHPVSVDRLVDELWPQEAPRSAANGLQVYVSRLRRHRPHRRSS
jgi:DNA-binding SARP family transcriptional activator